MVIKTSLKPYTSGYFNLLKETQVLRELKNLKYVCGVYKCIVYLDEKCKENFEKTRLVRQEDILFVTVILDEALYDLQKLVNLWKYNKENNQEVLNEKFS